MYPNAANSVLSSQTYDLGETATTLIVIVIRHFKRQPAREGFCKLWDQILFSPLATKYVNGHFHYVATFAVTVQLTGWQITVL